MEDFNNVAKNSLDEWIYFLKNNEIPDNFKAPGLKKAKKLLQYDKLSEQEKIDYDYHLDQKLYERGSIKTALFKGRFRGHAEGLAKGLAKGREEGRSEGHTEGREEGRTEAVETIVINSYHNGLQPEMIVAITDLTLDQIVEILKKHGLA